MPGRASPDLRVVPPTSLGPRVTEGIPREEDRAAEEGHQSSCTITSGTPEKKKASTLPPCLNPVCSNHYFVKDCPKTSDDLKKNLLEEHRAKKKSPGGKNIGDHLQRNRAGAESPLLIRSRTSPPVIPAELHGYRFACRIDSGADAVASPTQS